MIRTDNLETNKQKTYIMIQKRPLKIETYIRYNTIKTRRLNSSSPTMTPATIPLAP
jgi:hypothetical protein